MKAFGYRVGTRVAGALGFTGLRDRLRSASVMRTDLLREMPRKTRLLQVVGIPRSGTTILGVALNAHPAAVCLIEPFLSHLKSGSIRWPDLGQGERERKELPHEVIAELCTRPDLRWVGFKETFRLSHHRLFPNERFLRENLSEQAVDDTIAIVRDPRDVWVSTLTRYEWSRKLSLRRSFTESWNAFVEWVLEEGVYMVRYEDLVSDSARTMAGVAHRLGMEMSEEMLRPPGIKGMGDARAEEGGKLVSTSVGRYRRELSPCAVAYIEAHCAAGMRSLDYAVGETVGFVG